MKLLRSAAAALLFFAGAAHAQQVGPPAWINDLGLSAAQQEQVFKIFYAIEPLIRERLLAARQAHEELEDLAIAVSLNSDEGRTAFEAEAQALGDVAQIRLHASQAVYQLLTQEQRARVARLPNYE